MSNRKVIVTLGPSEKKKGVFLQFGQEAVYGEDGNPQIVTVAIVEFEDGKVQTVDPNKIQFEKTVKQPL